MTIHKHFAFPLIKRLASASVLAAAILIAVAGAAWPAAADSPARAISAGYRELKLKDVSIYDPYITNKYYVPMSEKRGLFVSLPDVSQMPVIELTIGAGAYNLDFIRNGAIVGSKIVDSSSSTPNISRAIVEAPESVAQATGYDALRFTPISGRYPYLSYVGLLESMEQAVVFDEIEPRKLTAVPFGGAQKTQYDVIGCLGYFSNDDETSISIEAQSISELDVALLSIETDKGKTVAKFPTDSILETILTSEEGLYTFTAKKVDNPPLYSIGKLLLRYRYAGSAEERLTSVKVFTPYNDEIYNSTEIRTVDNLETFEFVRQDGGTVTFEGESVSLDRCLFVPQGKKLVLNAGQTIDLSNGAVIFCRDAIEVNGTADNPVKIISTDGTGDGVVVLQANSSLGRSTVNYLICDNLDFVENGIYFLTGCVTFYESDVDFYGCGFLNSKSEDGLNVIRSDMTARYCTFYNACQDAFDSDFCTGLFENCHFELIGNDAFDVSTSDYAVKNCTFRDIHDKCLSIGENSTATIDGINADTAQAIIGAKDMSTVYASNLVGKDIFIGYLAYQKKPEFGHSYAAIENMALTGAKDFDYLIEAGEAYFLDGERKFPKGKKKEALIIEKIINEEPLLR
jgi:hypothetical protein